jgi:hypothetical protein
MPMVAVTIAQINTTPGVYIRAIRKKFVHRTSIII